MVFKMKLENNVNEIEVITGDGKDLNISPVYNHIDIEKPKQEKEKKKIIIPGNIQKKSC